MTDRPTTRKDIDEILDILKGLMQQTSEQLIQVKEEITDLKKSHDKLLNTIDHFVKRIDDYETEQVTRDSQFQKLLEWARKVSEKTGIPLENL